MSTATIYLNGFEYEVEFTYSGSPAKPGTAPWDETLDIDIEKITAEDEAPEPDPVMLQWELEEWISDDITDRNTDAMVDALEWEREANGF